MSNVFLLPLLLKYLNDTKKLPGLLSENIIEMITLVFLFISIYLFKVLNIQAPYSLYFVGFSLFLIQEKNLTTKETLFSLLIPIFLTVFEMFNFASVELGIFLVTLGISYPLLKNRKIEIFPLFLLLYIFLQERGWNAVVLEVFLYLGFAYQLNAINHSKPNFDYLLKISLLVFVLPYFSHSNENIFIILRFVLGLYLCFKRQERGDYLALALLIFMGNTSNYGPLIALSFISLIITSKTLSFLKEKIYSVEKDSDGKLKLDHQELLVLGLSCLLLTGIPGSIVTFIGEDGPVDKVLYLLFFSFYVLKNTPLKTHEFSTKESNRVFGLLFTPFVCGLVFSLYSGDYKMNLLGLIPLTILIGLVVLFGKDEAKRIFLERISSQVAVTTPPNRIFSFGMSAAPKVSEGRNSLKQNIYLISHELYSLLLIFFIMAFIYWRFA